MASPKKRGAYKTECKTVKELVIKPVSLELRVIHFATDDGMNIHIEIFGKTCVFAYYTELSIAELHP